MFFEPFYHFLPSLWCCQNTLGNLPQIGPAKNTSVTALGFAKVNKTESLIPHTLDMLCLTMLTSRRDWQALEGATIPLPSKWLGHHGREIPDHPMEQACCKKAYWVLQMLQHPGQRQYVIFNVNFASGLLNSTLVNSWGSKHRFWLWSGCQNASGNDGCRGPANRCRHTSSMLLVWINY
jgi:hypothetical protein